MSENGFLFIWRAISESKNTINTPSSSDQITVNREKWCNRADPRCEHPSPQYASVCVMRAIMCARFREAEKYAARTNAKASKDTPKSTHQSSVGV